VSTPPLKADAPAYTDINGLSKLKRAAGQDDPAAIRAVAQQFEAMFTRMMLKSMRDAVGKDPMFGSDQEQQYQDMADDQMSVQLAKGKGLGLADMLVKQLQKLGVKGADAAAGVDPTKAAADAAGGTAGSEALSGSAAGGSGVGSGVRSGSAVGGGAASGGGYGWSAGKAFPINGAARAKAAAAYSATQRASTGAASASGTSTPSTTSTVSDASKANFVQDLWPQAQEAGQVLGVDPRHLIAQAALETNWGQNVPQDTSGRSSNNLFGMKAASDWSGSTVTNNTQEVQGGVATNTSAQFKAYATPTQSVQDYVSLLRNNPRYANALNTGSDVHAFANALQRGGYATDPDYASKIAAVANTVAHKVPLSGNLNTDNLKLADSLPISADTGAL
jgi:flagellar protein FlgJ